MEASREGWSAVCPLQRFNHLTILTRRSHFPRNEPANPTEYVSERPEMNFAQREIREGQDKKRKPKQKGK
jgi:hypothetical protein